MNLKEIIERIKSKTGYSQNEIASVIFGISSTNLSNKIKRNSVDLDAVIRWANNASVNLHWLLTGKGSPNLKESWDAEAPMSAHEMDDDPDVIELMKMSKQIIKSDTNYAVSLMANIRTLHQAMLAEHRYRTIEERVARIEKERCAVKQPTRIREHDPPEQKEQIIKRRAR